MARLEILIRHRLLAFRPDHVRQQRRAALSRPAVLVKESLQFFPDEPDELRNGVPPVKEPCAEQYLAAGTVAHGLLSAVASSVSGGTDPRPAPEAIPSRTPAMNARFAAAVESEAWERGPTWPDLKGRIDHIGVGRLR